MKKQKYVLVHRSLDGCKLFSDSFFTLGEALATWNYLSGDTYPRRDAAQILNVEEGTVLRLEYGVEEENMVEA
jgi:hypothetical protein